jgi:hypothetical protein
MPYSCKKFKGRGEICRSGILAASSHWFFAIPAQAGIQLCFQMVGAGSWTPACAGVTVAKGADSAQK